MFDPKDVTVLRPESSEHVVLPLVGASCVSAVEAARGTPAGAAALDLQAHCQGHGLEAGDCQRRWIGMERCACLLAAKCTAGCLQARHVAQNRQQPMWVLRPMSHPHRAFPPIVSFFLQQ